MAKKPTITPSKKDVLIDLGARRTHQEIQRYRQHKPITGTLFRTIVEKAPVLLWMSGPDARFIFFNEGWLRFTGRTLKEEVGFGWFENIHPDDAGAYIETYQSDFKNRQAFAARFRLKCHDGLYRWILNNGDPYFSDSGVFCGYIGACTDITDVYSS